MSMAVNPHTGRRAHVFHREGYAHTFRMRAAGDAFDYPTALVGKTPDGNVSVYVDTTLEANAKIVAAGLLGLAPELATKAAGWFGIPMQPVNLIVAPLSGQNDGSGGAYHYGCDFQSGGDLYIDYAGAHGVTMDAGLFMAELSECFMGAQNKGWNCGDSPGEALSRACAEEVSGGPNGALASFASVPSWIQAGMPDWVDTTQGTDGDYPSIGCGMAEISDMMAQGFSLAEIAQAGGTTWAETNKTLTGRTTAWADLQAGMKALGSTPVTNDDPFGGLASNPQPPQPQPQPKPQPGGETKAAALKVVSDFAAMMTALINASTLPDK